MFNVLLVILLILLIVFGTCEGFTCSKPLFTPENVMKYTCDKLNKKNLDLYNSEHETNSEPYVLKHRKDKQCNKALGNPLSASDIYYNENRPYPNSLPFVYKF